MKIDKHVSIRTVLLFIGFLFLVGCNNSTAERGDTALSSNTSKDYFKSVPVSENFFKKGEDSYWVDAGDYNNDGKPDLIAYGLGGYEKGEKDEKGKPRPAPIYLYINPGISDQDTSQIWKRQLIQIVKTPVGMNQADIDGDKDLDIILSDEYGFSIFDCKSDGGFVYWLENPFDPRKQSVGDTVIWKRHSIGETPAMHRLAVGRFTQNAEDEIITLPVVGECTDKVEREDASVYKPIKLKLYQKPTDKKVTEATSWKETPIDNSMVLIHDYAVKKNPELTDYDALLISSKEGISWLYLGRDKEWHIKNISKGQTDLADYEKTRLKLTGTNTADIGKIEGKPLQYMVALEPFHGGTLAVYKKQNSNWERKVLHKYGHPDELGFSVGHYVITADFNKDKTDEFLVVFPKSPKGILYGIPKNIEKFEYDTVRIFDQTSARVSLADFNQDGMMDFATTGYNVRGYYEDSTSRLFVHINQMKR